jgi:hypothetical protein
MDQLDRTETTEIYGALACLSLAKGVALRKDDVMIKKSTASSGNPVYVIRALGAIERVVGNVLASAMMRLTSGPIGIWALRQEEVDQLLRNARAVA